MPYGPNIISWYKWDEISYRLNFHVYLWGARICQSKIMKMQLSIWEREINVATSVNALSAGKGEKGKGRDVEGAKKENRKRKKLTTTSPRICLSQNVCRSRVSSIALGMSAQNCLKKKNKFILDINVELTSGGGNQVVGEYNSKTATSPVARALHVKPVV